ncbi:hypothetical protein [Salinisphaera sp. Q1T1-3]|uniref:hypothetical protein n=1 Tax=Salinisphaera sp. Q1T1-3 TaxID=2321229 RepID=UPI000E742A20|nr:hypothetical protein [Salinisphaera sp. Q1T1-3]RJS94675.1 hypothetical protein D3260_02560 [Salinisphaera sp. Q1T1-3]
MSQFDLGEFEAQIHALLAAHEQLKHDYETLRAAHESETRRNREIRDQLGQVIDRIRALEAQAGNV